MAISHEKYSVLNILQMESSICGDLKFLILQELSAAFRNIYQLTLLSLYPP